VRGWRVLTLSFNSGTLGTVMLSRVTVLHSGHMPSETPFFILPLILLVFKNDLPAYGPTAFSSLHVT
jgi:hypothetical protein